MVELRPMDVLGQDAHLDELRGSMTNALMKLSHKTHTPIQNDDSISHTQRTEAQGRPQPTNGTPPPRGSAARKTCLGA